MQRKAVHYINQFYAGLGGETMADTGFSILEEKKGPALGLEQLWKGEMEISSVVCCGDNYVNTEANEAEVFARLTEVIRRDQPYLSQAPRLMRADMAWPAPRFATMSAGSWGCPASPLCGGKTQRWTCM